MKLIIEAEVQSGLAVCFATPGKQISAPNPPPTPLSVFSHHCLHFALFLDSSKFREVKQKKL
jgi:hypothetical protein